MVTSDPAAQHPAPEAGTQRAHQRGHRWINLSWRHRAMHGLVETMCFSGWNHGLSIGFPCFFSWNIFFPWVFHVFPHETWVFHGFSMKYVDIYWNIEVSYAFLYELSLTPIHWYLRKWDGQKLSAWPRKKIGRISWSLRASNFHKFSECWRWFPPILTIIQHPWNHNPFQVFNCQVASVSGSQSSCPQQACQHRVREVWMNSDVFFSKSGSPQLQIYHDIPWCTMICSFEPWYIIWTISCTQGLDGWNMGHASNGTKQRSSSGSTFSRAPWVDQDGVQVVAAWEPMTKLLYLINLFFGPVGNPERT